MGFKLLILGSGEGSDKQYLEEWPRMLKEAIPDYRGTRVPFGR